MCANRLFASQVSEAVVRSGLRADVGRFSGLVSLINREELVVAQFLKYAMLLVGAFVVMSVPAMAQEGAPPAAVSETVPLLNLTATFGAGLVVIGAGLGISRLSTAAFESMARQPEVAADIKGSMVIVAAMIEGAAVIGLIVCMIK
jgi:F-type H+-transporting ATPase subunit c